MGVDNKAIEKVVEPDEDDEGEFQWIDSDDEVENEQNRRNEQVAEKALDDDIDDKVQYWIDCIRSSVPGAAILFVASHADFFDDNNLGGIAEARRRCQRMKDRILRREERRVQSLRKRLLKLENSHRADSPAAQRIRELLSPYRLPKLIFQNDGCPDAVMRISGTFDRGFGALRERVINLATGRETECPDFRRILRIATGRIATAEEYGYPFFRGHVGAVIPPERLAIRALVRGKRAKFQLLEWSSFVEMVEEELGYRPSDTDLNDTLRFLSRIGEILFFGEVDGLEERPHIAASRFDDGIFYDSSDDEEADEYGDYTVAECDIQLAPSMSEDNASITGSSIADLSLQSKVLGMRPDSLSQFIFINPKWLVLALKVVMRHDLSQHLQGVKTGRASSSKWATFGRADSFFNSAVRCPILRDSDARLLWSSNAKLFKSASRAVQGTATEQLSVDAFSFLEKLLVYFGVFVPIDLMRPNVELSNELYSRPLVHENDPSSVFYFLPSQLKPRERPRREIDEDTFKTTDEKKVCLCHTWLFRDGAPPGIFERITSSVLRALHAATASPDRSDARYNGQLEFDEILCWRQAFQITLKTSFVAIDNRDGKSYLDVFAQIEDQASETCVAGDSTAPGLKRLVISGMGLESHHTRLIWEGGFKIILDEVDRTIREYRGLDYSREPACHKCLATRDVRSAAVWSWSRVREASQRSDRGVLTCENNHRVDLRYLTGQALPSHRPIAYQEQSSFNENVHYTKICPGVCLIGLWDGHRIHRCGSGFVVDAKRGLVVTAGHVVIDPSGSAAPPNSFFRRQARYYGLSRGQVLVGLPPSSKVTNPNSPVGPEAVWRYVARIDTEDVCNVDAAVLRITARLENDVDNHEDLLSEFSNIRALKTQEDFQSEGLHQLKLSPRCEIEQNVRLIGYGQTTETSIDRSIEVYRGYVSRKFMNSEWRGRSDRGYVWKHYFSIVTSLTLEGQSGCPCVNDQAQVIGILSQADRADKNKCFVVPTGEFIHIISDARSWEEDANNVIGEEEEIVTT
jgi:S1-C subfamily serine protease